jgi:hypothetical protein
MTGMIFGILSGLSFLRPESCYEAVDFFLRPDDGDFLSETFELRDLSYLMWSEPALRSFEFDPVKNTRQHDEPVRSASMTREGNLAALSAESPDSLTKIVLDISLLHE